MTVPAGLVALASDIDLECFQARTSQLLAMRGQPGGERVHCFQAFRKKRRKFACIMFSTSCRNYSRSTDTSSKTWKTLCTRTSCVFGGMLENNELVRRQVGRAWREAATFAPGNTPDQCRTQVQPGLPALSCGCSALADEFIVS